MCVCLPHRWLPKGNSPRRGRTADAPPTESTGIVRGVYCAMVVLIQLVLLPRFNVRPDPDYDPSDDWEVCMCVCVCVCVCVWVCSTRDVVVDAHGATHTNTQA